MVPLRGSNGNSWIFNITLNPLQHWSPLRSVIHFEIIGDLTPENTATIAETPDPSSLSLMGTGILFGALS
jgi:hypothetical protein